MEELVGEMGLSIDDFEVILNKLHYLVLLLVPACYVPVYFKKHNARKAVWFTKATVHWSNFCIC